MEGCGARKPQAFQSPCRDVLRVEPQQVGRCRCRTQGSELRAHDARKDVHRLGVVTLHALRLAGQSGQHRVFAGAEHGREFAPGRPAGQQSGQLLIAPAETIVD